MEISILMKESSLARGTLRGTSNTKRILILLDMVGEKELNIHREQNSEDFAKPVNDKVFRLRKSWGTASRS